MRSAYCKSPIMLSLDLLDARHSHIARVQKAQSDIQTRNKAWKKRPRRPGEFDVAGGLRYELGSGARPGMHARLAARPPIPRAYRVALRRSRRAHLPGALESRQVWAPALCRPCGAPGSFSLSLPRNTGRRQCTRPCRRSAAAARPPAAWAPQ